MISPAQHTPTPWRSDGLDNAGQAGIVSDAESPSASRIGWIVRNVKANANFIVKAVNSHEKLIDAHDDLVGALQDIARQAEDETCGIQADRLTAIANQAHAAISASEATT